MGKKIFKVKERRFVFFMKPCPEANELKRLIYDHGGILYKSKRKPEYIALLPHESNYVLPNPPKYPVYSSMFVYDSIKARKLLDVDHYELRSFCKKRLKYTREDEEKMIEYVKNAVGNPNKRSFWEKATDISLNHSYDSLRYHWRNVMKGEDKEEAEKIAIEKFKIYFKIIRPDEAETPKKSQSQFISGSLKSELDISNENDIRTPSLAKCFENQFKRKRETSIEGEKKIKEINNIDHKCIKISQNNPAAKELSTHNTQDVDQEELKRIRQSPSKLTWIKLGIKPEINEEIESISVASIPAKVSQPILCSNSVKEIQTQEKSKSLEQESAEKENIRPYSCNENPKTEKKDAMSFYFHSPPQKIVSEEQFYSDAEINQIPKIEINKTTQIDLLNKTIERAQNQLPTSIASNIFPKIEEINQSYQIQKVNEQYNLQDMFCKSEDLFITCNNQARTVHDLRPLRLLSIDFDIENEFAKLVKLCQKISKKDLTEKEVISALESQDGVVADTISYFLAQKFLCK